MQPYIEAGHRSEMSVSDSFNGQSVGSIAKILLKWLKQDVHDVDYKVMKKQKITAKTSIKTSHTGDWEEGEI